MKFEFLPIPISSCSFGRDLFFFFVFLAYEDLIYFCSIFLPCRILENSKQGQWGAAVIQFPSLICGKYRLLLLNTSFKNEDMLYQVFCPFSFDYNKTQGVIIRLVRILTSLEFLSSE